MSKWVWIAGSVGLFVVVGIALYYRSQRRVQAGINYDLSPAGEIFNITGNTGAGATDSSGRRIAVDSRIPPAADLVAQQKDAFLKSENTMTEIKQRIGYNANLFQGLTSEQKNKIANAIATKFSINPESPLSFPTWTQDKSPTLYNTLKARSQQSYAGFRAGSSALTAFTTIPEWGINFQSTGIQADTATGFQALKNFYTNAAREILRLEDQTRYEAVQYLRRQGWRFSDYGDV